MGKRVVVAGWVGSNNAGDELIHRSMVTELRRIGIEPLSVSQDPPSTVLSHGVEAFEPRHLWKELGRAEGFVFGGGTLIQQESSLLNNAYHLLRLRMAHLRNVPAVVAGLGIGELKTRGARRGVRRTFGKVLRIAVRDHDSKSALERLGVTGAEVGCDLVFAMDAPEGASEDVLAVGLRPPVAGGFLPTSLRRKEHSEEWLTTLADSLDRNAETTGLTTRFIAMDRIRDHAVHEAVADRMRTTAETVQPDLDDIIAEFGKARATVGMRYHAAVASLVAGRPVVGLNYARKVASLADESLGSVINHQPTPDGMANIADSVGRKKDSGPED